MNPSHAMGRSDALFARGYGVTALAALLCGLHCALTPLVVVLLPALAVSEGVERLFLIGTGCVGAAVLLMGPARRRPLILLTFGLGVALWTTSLAGLMKPLPENVTSAAASLILAGALVRGARTCRSGECAVCLDEEPAS